MKRKIVIPIVCAGLALLAATVLLRVWKKGGTRDLRPAFKRTENVLIITLDTTRADHIGAYGYRHGRTPAIDALASEGIRCAHAQSPVPLTLPAHVSIMTGTYPTFHGIRNNGSYFLPPQAETLAEILKQKGYQTAAFVSSFILDSRFGLDQGFDLYSDRMNTGGDIKDLKSERPAAEVYADFKAWLDSVDGGRPFFCWLHFYDPHLPYAPPEPFKSDPALSPYDGEIGNVDLHLGRVIERLRDRGIYDKTMIVIAGDHGEAFGEHTETGHGIFCYQETLAVPLLIRIPGEKSGVIEAATDLVDIMPTVLAGLDMKIPPQLQGVSLLPLIAGKEAPERELYFESLFAKENMGGAPLTGLLAGGWKYIDLPRAESYDLNKDPAEKTNLVSREAVRSDRMKTRLKGWQTRSRGENIDTSRALSPEERRRLDSLGYISASAPLVSGKTLPDPKDLIAGWSETVAGRTFQDAGDIGQAERHLLRAIELTPVFLNPYVDLANIRLGRGDTQGGMSILKLGVDRNPGDAAFKIEYGRALAEAGRPAEALDILREAEKQRVFGQRETIHIMIATTLSRMGRYAQAVESFRRALEIEPDNFAAARDLGYCLYRSKRFAEAAASYKRAEAGMPEDPAVPAELALCHAAMKDYEAAALSFDKAIRLQPSQEIYFNYAVMAAESGDLAKAVQLMGTSLEQTPRDPALAERASSLLREWKHRR
jgi:arylsulfatase A-like enzyme/tetratricopeptide (TPR) repeat protein